MAKTSKKTLFVLWGNKNYKMGVNRRETALVLQEMR